MIQNFQSICILSIRFNCNPFAYFAAKEFMDVFFSVEWISVFLSRSLKDFMVDLDHSGIYLAKGLYRCLIRDREDRLLINCSR